MTKQDLLSELMQEREVITTALNFSYIVAAGDWQAKFATFTLSAGTIDLEIDSSHIRYSIARPGDLVETYRAPGALNNAAVNLIRVTIRNAVSQYYEKLQTFCLGDRIRQPKWEQAAWRPLARLARNSFSHNFLFDFWDRKSRTLRPDVKYNFPSGRTIEVKNIMHDKPITGDSLPIEAIFELLDVMGKFVESET